MVEIAFYHHSTTKIEQTLPVLLERTLARGWRAVVQFTQMDMLQKYDEALWAYRAESFLPHGGNQDSDVQSLPIYLTITDDNPNQADIRFFLQCAEVFPLMAGHSTPKTRAALMFDGADDTELSSARAQWKMLKDAGFELVYYQQSEGGKWHEKFREPKKKA